jgi:hypothetical protein
MDPMQLAHVFRELAPEQRLNLGVRAPAPWLATGADNLRVTTFGTVAAVDLVIAIRWLTLAGEVVPFVFHHTPASDGSPVETLHRLSDGWLLTSTVQVASGAVPSPGFFVRLDIVAGLTGAVQLVGTLAQGFVSSQAAISYPLSPIVGPDAAGGAPLTVVGANPAAGAEFTVNVPVNTQWRVLSIRAPLVTDGTVANRETRLRIISGGNQVAIIPSGVVQAASETRDYLWFPGGVFHATPATGDVSAPMPAVVLPAGAIIESLTLNLQAGDNWGPPVLLVMTSAA